MSFLEPEDQTFVDQLSELLTERVRADVTGILDQVGEYLAVEAISIFTVDSDTGELVLTHAADPVGQELIGLRLSPGQGVVGWVTTYNEDLIVPSADLDPRFYSGVDAKSGFVTRSILCVPMATHGGVVGAIEAMNKIAGHFNADDVVLLQQVANIVVKYI